jgi:hypothetical protein
MKKLYFLACMLFYGIHVLAQCGVTSGFQPITNGMLGSNVQAAETLSSGWTTYSYLWERNGIPFGTSSFEDNQGVGYDNVCLTVKATNVSTGDSCESKYCQLLYTTFPGMTSLFVEADSVGPLTLQIYGGVCTSYINGGGTYHELDYGDGVIENTNFATHTFPDTGTYIVKYSYSDFTGGSDFVTRKVYVGNGHKNFSTTAILGSASCFSVNTAYTSNPPFFGGYAQPVEYSPLSLTYYTNIPWGTYFASNFYGTGIDIIEYFASDSLGNPLTNCKLIAIPDCKIAPDTLSGTIWLDADADGIWDAGELPYSVNTKVKMSYGSYESVSDNSGNYTFPVPQTPSYVYLSNLPQNFLVTFPSSNGHYNHFTTSSMHPGYHFGVVDRGVNICGKAYIDINSNGVYDATPDINYNSVLVNAYNTTLNKTFTTTTDQYGNYCIALPVGNYVVKAYGINLDSATVVPDSIIVNSPAPGSFYNNNFGFQTPVVGGNLGIFLNAGGMPRPGFAYSLTGSVVNSGVDVSSGTVVINYSPTLIYVSASSGGVHNATNKTVTWQTGTMAPTSSRYFSANFTVPVATPLGTVLGSSSTVTTGATYTDYDLSNNSSSRSSIVIGSFDPNDKLVAPRGVGAGGNVLHSQRMYYRINFQNTGTASAINIIVQDEIDANLDMTTFRMERASHNYTRIITGNNITWKFFNINLPDSNTNEPLSHGYIEFSIKPKQGLPDGTVIANSADIYFDYNAPIFTNVVTNTLQTSLTGINEYENIGNVIIYPNPFKNELVIKQVSFQQEINSITIYDVYGKLIYSNLKPAFEESLLTIKVPEIASGIYILKVENSGGVFTQKLLKQ